MSKIRTFKSFLVKSAICLSLVLSSCLSVNKGLQRQKFNERIKKFNEVTNLYCTSLGLDFSEENPIRSEMFFRCKIELAKKAKISNPIKPDQIIFNKDLKEYVKSQDLQYMNSLENLNYYRNSLLDNKHHKICEKRGYTIESLKQDEIESYLSCRESLISSFNLEPAYKDKRDLNYRQSSYNIKYVLNKKQDTEIKISRNFKENYPFCSEFKVSTEEALDCKNHYAKKRNCLQGVKTKSFAKKRQLHEICQQKLYIKLPDSLLIKEENEDTLTKKRNFNADLYANPSFYEFLSNKKKMDSFMAKITRKKKEKEAKSKAKEVNKIDNSYQKLYSVTELTSLRQRFIAACTDEIDPKIINFISAGTKTCNTITLKWEDKGTSNKSHE